MSPAKEEVHDGPDFESSTDFEQNGGSGSEETPETPTGRSKIAQVDVDEDIPGLGGEGGFNARRRNELRDGGIVTPASLQDDLERPSSADGSSIPDDTPSVPGSINSSPGRGGRSQSYSQSPTPSLRPFERRFQARLSSSQLNVPRSASPAFLNSHSRQSSAAWTIQDEKETEVEVPWEVVRWTKLKKMSGQAFSEIGKRNFGRPTCLAVSSFIVFGTSKGITLVFDYNQNLKCIMGQGTKATEAGAVTSVCISADHTTVASGHSSGDIFTWEIAKPAKPFMQIPIIDRGRAPNTDGHVSNAAVLHLGFLGIRHTALASADDKGMAFSHLATRGMGMVARTVKTTRILGRYPAASAATAASRKPSSVLSFSPLPLGNCEHVADGMGLVAMLTPYLLVIVSTMPIAQTQFKSPRPRGVASHSAMTGALAWFPSVKIKSDAQLEAGASQAKLAYCWSNVLTVLDVIEVDQAEGSTKAEPPSLQFKPRSRWKAEEAIVGIQWLGRSVLAVLTITQQLVILEDVTMLVTDSSDLIYRHIYHTDLFSSQLTQLVDGLDDDELAPMHGVVADAFYMSFRAYKGRLFLLGYDDVSFGTLSNWADRIHALVEDGKYVRAINLTTGYYTGNADRVTVGLPEDDASRQSMVRERLLKLITASLSFDFSHQSKAAPLPARREHVEELTAACINACVSMTEFDFLFEEVYPWYQENSATAVFLECLEPRIDEHEIKLLPPEVIKDLVNLYTSKGLNSRLEEILCLLEPRTMDIDQVTTLCRKYHLYDALLYVWNEAIADYTTILNELLQQGTSQANGHLSNGAIRDVDQANDATKIFPYLSYILTGRRYPTGDDMIFEQSNLAKADIYNFFFSGRGSDGVTRGDVSPVSSRSGSKSTFLNLRMVLDYDAPSFLSMLNEAFEDNFLNGPSERLGNEIPGGLTESQKFGLSVNRQWIVSILLEVLTPPEYEADDIVYLYMFIARNLPKFPQFILLPGHVLQRVLTGLCTYSSEENAEDCELSVEYLLSFYQPPDTRPLIPVLQKAQFYRVLKRIHKSERQYAKLLETCFEDRDSPDEVFDCIADCFDSRTGLTEGQLADVKAVITEHASSLVGADVRRTATLLSQTTPELHETMLEVIADDQSQQFLYLQVVIEPEAQEGKESSQDRLTQHYLEKYVRLMCKYEPSRVSTYIDHLKTGDLRLAEVLPALEDCGAIDAAAVLVARNGMVREGVDRLMKHMTALEAAMSGLIDGSSADTDDGYPQRHTNSLVTAIQKDARVAIWICQEQTRLAAQNLISGPLRSSNGNLEQLSFDEELWLNAIDTIVNVVKSATETLEQLKQQMEGAEEEQSENVNESKQIGVLRGIVQESFTALLNATTVTRKNENQRTDLKFLRILRAFLTRASISTPSLSNLRSVLGDIFSAYSYEEELLSLSNKLLDKDVFVHVTEANKLRQRGWRPLGQVCEACNKRVWGPGAGSNVWDDFERVDKERRAARSIKDTEESKTAEGPRRGKGKAVPRKDGNAQIDATGPTSQDGVNANYGPGSGPIVVFACRHVFHRSCLESMKAKVDEGGDDRQAAKGQPSLVCPLEG